MNNKIQLENSVQQIKRCKNLYINPLERALSIDYKSYQYSLKLIDVYPVYCFEGQKFICYRKILKSKQQYLMIQEHINSSTYEWKENVYHNTISLYHFMSIKRYQEWTASWALSKGMENSYLWWEIWGVLEDGTILSPRETRKIIKLLQSNAIKSNMEGLDDYAARKAYTDHLAKGNFNVL